jgi:DNA transposition AAA+ family ATPase
MNQNQKFDIQLLTKSFVERYGSQKQASNHLRGVSEGTLFNVLSNKWENISEDMWRNIAKQVGYTNRSWHLVETQDFLTLTTFFADAKDYGNVFALVGRAGCGKSFTAEWFCRQVQNAVYVECKEFWNRKTFLRKILEKMGKDYAGMNVSELMDYIVECFLKMDRPLLILDEFDKLSDQLIFFFISLYNELKGKCGIIIQGTEYLKKRIKRGKDTQKKGYEEIYSRIGRRFIDLSGTNKSEVEKICKANGITSPQDITEIFNEYEGDLRRVERLVHKRKLKEEKSRQAA